METKRHGFWIQAVGVQVFIGIVLGLGLAGAASAEEPAAGSAFDRVFSTTSPDQEGEVGIAGLVVERFAPPVAAPIAPGSPGLPLAQAQGPVLRPCDTPGSGCRNPQPNAPQVVVPPIVPGTRPPRTQP
ncbi:MAG: hypothetical protein R3F21_18785 [Myxococcota bacterium]